MNRRNIAAAAIAAACMVGLSSKFTHGEEPTTQSANPPATAPATQPIQPKELSAHVKKGLAWLEQHQLASGGWGQGEESQNMRQGNEQLKDTANVADTCMAALALMRAGSTPMHGPHATQIRGGVDFVCEQIEKSDETSLFITDIRGTRVQGKLGQYVDTFLSALLLAEVKDRMPDEASNARVLAALDKTMNKIEKNQQQDGAFAQDGWAPALAQGLASKSLNRAAQNGARVDEQVRKRAEQYARGNFDEARGVVAAGGAAGVELYARASNMQSMKDSDDTNTGREVVLEDILRAPTTQPEEKDKAQRELDDIKQNRRELAAATQAVVARLDDKQFIAGFGSNGGEEFLSHMNIGETLVAKGGADWEKWDQSMTENINRIQNEDGSWSGDHCITGRTFCTSAALMTLMVDRSTVPVAGEIRKK